MAEHLIKPNLKSFPFALPSILAAVTAISLAAAPGSARATPLNYVFSGASADLDGFTETITGSFTFDASTDTQSAVSITLSGGAPFSGTFTYAAPYVDTNNTVVEANGSVANTAVEVGFTSALTVSPDAIIGVIYQNNAPVPICGIPCTGFSDFSTEAGSAVFASGGGGGTPTPTPEPASLAILGTALGLFGFGKVASRQVR